MKRCSQCGVSQPLSSFRSRTGNRDGRTTVCKSCLLPDARLRHRRSYESNPQKLKDARWAKRLKSQYGITVEEYDAMVEAQDGMCALCGKPESVKRNGRVVRLAVDHCHETGRVRGLLCFGCNVSIGRIGAETTDGRLRIMEYLK